MRKREFSGFALKRTPGILYIRVEIRKDVMSEPRHERGSKWLSTANLRPTRQRVALAALLVGDGQNRHVTAESLHAASQDAGEAVSLATVYNTLRAFCDAGLIKEITVDGSKSYFDTRTDDHPHFYWEDEARLTDAPAEELEIKRLPKAPAGAEISKVDVVIRLRKR
jgi:Fur family iron response transcriptional regulator